MEKYFSYNTICTTESGTELPQYDICHSVTFRGVAPTKTPSPASPLEYPERDLHVNEQQRTKNHTFLPKVKCTVQARIPTTFGTDLRLHVYKNDFDDKSHLAYVFGDQIQSLSLNLRIEDDTDLDRMIRGAYKGRLWPGQLNSEDSRLGITHAKPPKESETLVRVHSECYTGETAWSARCDCGEQLEEAARMMSTSRSGVIIYLRQEGRGIGLADKLKAYNLQDLGFDTVDANLALGHPADSRMYGIATAILMDLGLGNDSGSPGIRLLTNNPDKVNTIGGPNGEVTVKERVPTISLECDSDSSRSWGLNSPELHTYLETKVHRMGHLILATAGDGCR
ncbi:GTP cyclohydrolase II [Penicillium malachiteum]|uniref:GTP cyclohydrolase II n=1 Tax=Penicillium malachiteum TaxID=1324776 RepID=UPI002547D1DB|nr:GTP cyclohydrolase II [Penicillium malachiteum]KAJ5737878.1 GTP cyclohydrolase II [Penicillium malachiteum]